jgi:polar amino acid transport system permease protein
MDWLIHNPLVQDLGILALPAMFNVYFAAASIPLGSALALMFALGKASDHPVFSRISRVYIYTFRGSPIFIQFFMIYSVMLVLNQPLWRPWGIDGFVLHPLFLGPLVLTLNTAAYMAEILHGALKTIPRGEIEAARAFGMSRWQQFRSITWPNMVRIAWPAYTNEVIFTFHATALVYFTLPVIDQQKDLMNKAGELFERDFNVFLHFPAAALYFLAISLLIFLVSSRVYTRLMRHLSEDARPRIRFLPRYMRQDAS